MKSTFSNVSQPGMMYPKQSSIPLGLTVKRKMRIRLDLQPSSRFLHSARIKELISWRFDQDALVVPRTVTMRLGK